MEIHDDVAFAIFSKLPLKSLKRFTLAHKSWVDLLENPNFMSMFRSNFLLKHRSYYDDTSLLLLQHQTSDSHASLYLLSDEKLEKTLKSDWLPYQEHGRFLIVSGSGIHGILCGTYGGPDYKYVLWNPDTQEFRVTPPSPRESLPYMDVDICTYGFGYDPVSDDFKVLRHIIYHPHTDYEEDEDDWKGVPIRIPRHHSWEIYSLRSNSWRKLDADMPLPGGAPDGIHTNGVCHWLGYTMSDDYSFDTYLESFNFSNEVFYTTPLLLDDRKVQKYLAVLNESIALISIHEETTTLHISILGELGVMESWTKLFTVGLGPLHGIGLPIAVGKMGEVIFFRREKGELALFDLSTQMLKEIAAPELLSYDQMIIYKESIIHIGRTEAEGEDRAFLEW